MPSDAAFDYGDCNDNCDEGTPFKCPKCGHSWDVHGFYYELGSRWPKNQDNTVCSECGAEGEPA